jgi:uncharacterized protein (DUF169 family)
MNPETIASKLKELLGLRREPVGVSFLSRPPSGVPRFEGKVPAGCAFWLRAETEAFYTEAEHHAECPIGTLTMGFDIAPERQAEAQQFFANLCGVGYVSEAELVDVPRVPAGHRVVLYSPLRSALAAPDAVITRGDALQAMMLYEAGRRLKLGDVEAVMGRPTCAAIPSAMAGNSVSLSTGCIGARIHARLSPEEMVFALPGRRLEEILTALEQVCSVNHELSGYHEKRRVNPGASASS